MTSQKKKPILKIKKEDLSHFTLSEVKENVSPNTQKRSDYSESELEQRNAEENSFWQGRLGKMWMAIFSVGIFISIAAGALIYRADFTKESITKNITVTPVATLEGKLSPSPSVEEAVDISKYMITVLNGSGISGEAARLKDLLEKEKFSVSSIGNADKLTYKETIIKAKKHVSKEYLDTLVSFLNKSYSLDDFSELSQDEEVDITIIIGRTKK